MLCSQKQDRSVSFCPWWIADKMFFMAKLLKNKVKSLVEMINMAEVGSDEIWSGVADCVESGVVIPFS